MHMIEVGDRLINGDTITYVEKGVSYGEKVGGMPRRYDVVRLYFIGAGSFRPLEVTWEEGGEALLASLRAAGTFRRRDVARG